MSNREISYRNMTKYFVPLALQAMTQSITYPLVVMVASRGKEGAINIAALAQASAVSLFLFTFCAGLIITGMVYCDSKEGLERFKKLNRIFTGVITVIYAICCIPAVAHGIFGYLMGLPPDMEKATRFAFVLGLPLTFLFNLRNPPLVVLFNHRETGLAYGATVGRLVLTLLLSYICSNTKLVGIFWAAVCQSVPIVLEFYALKYFAGPFIKKLPESFGRVPSLKEMFTFTMSFSIGNVLICFSTYLIGAFSARAPNPERMLPVYYAVLGIAGPAAFGATRIQALIIAFGSDNKDKKRRLVFFTCVSGIVLGLVPLIFLLPFIDSWYYIILQRLGEADLKYIRETGIALILFPLAVSLRSYMEGWAAHYKKPVPVIAGQGVYLGAVATAAFCALSFGISGHLIGPISLVAGNIFAAVIVAFSLNIEKRGEPPVTEETIAVYSAK